MIVSRIGMMSLLGMAVAEAIPQRYVVVSDLGGVAAIVSEFNVAKRAFLSDKFRTAWRELSGVFGAARAVFSCATTLYKRAQPLVFEAANRVGTRGGVPARNTTGILLPGGIYELQAGTLTTDEALKRLPAAIAAMTHEGRFSNDLERAFVEAVLEITFHQDGLVEAMSANKEFVKLLEWCNTISPFDNLPIAPVILLSNFNEEQFEALQKKPALAELINAIPRSSIFISGARHSDTHLKPSSDAFISAIHYACATYHIRPDQIIYLDDQAENCAGMQAALEQAGVPRHHACKNVLRIANPQHGVRDALRLIQKLVSEDSDVAPAQQLQQYQILGA